MAVNLAEGEAEGRQETTLIGRGSLVDGVFRLEHSLRVEGVLRGVRLTAGERLVVAEGGIVQAQTIEVGEAIIKGAVFGALRARRQVHLEAGGRFRGVLETPRLVLEEGAEMVEDRELMAPEKPVDEAE